MEFKEFWKGISPERDEMKDVAKSIWNAAIDEAVQAVANRAASLEGGKDISLIIRDVKKLKGT